MTHIPPPDPIRVVIVDDDVRLREGLAFLVNETEGLTCVGHYSAVEHALRSIAALAPHVILLDINLPGMSGIEGVKALHERCQTAEVLMLTVYSEDAKIFESICAGAVGYLLKNMPFDRVVSAILETVGGGAPMSPEIARRVVSLFQRSGAADEHGEDLTPQETRLLALLARGATYQAAAREMHVSVNTVRNYVRSVYEKLHVHSASAAVAKAFRRGLI